MKRILLTIFLSVLFSVSFAQELQYHPVPFNFDSTIWCEFYEEEEVFDEGTYNLSPYLHYIQFKIDTNYTEYDGKKYRHILQSNDGINYINTVLGIREDTLNKRIYVRRYMDSINEDILLYDFSLNVGDTFVSNVWDNYVVDTVDTINIGGVLRKRISFTNDYSYAITNYVVYPAGHWFELKYYWIEGIGSTLGLLFPIFTPDFEISESVLTCFIQNDSIIYHEPHFSECYPAPSSITSPTLSKPKIITYPNPAKNQITFSFQGQTFETLQVINSTGIIVKNIQLPKQETFTLSVKELPSGVYAYRLSGKNGTSIGKFIVR